jgi:hypothetical protein
VFTSQDPTQPDFYFDLLTPEKQRFAEMGEGIIPPLDAEGKPDAAKVGEVWLNTGDVNAPDDTTTVFDVAGTADKDNLVLPFEAQITIGKNRKEPVQNPALPGAKPICKARIVSPIDIHLLPSDGGTLLLRIDARAFFAPVDFSRAQKVSDAPLKYTFADTAEGSGALFDGMTVGTPYTFTWTNP